jgi:hypothetical protein
MKTKTIALTLLALMLQPAWANTKMPFGFLKSSPSEIAALAKDGVVYSYDMKSSKDWGTDVNSEAELFKNYVSFETWDVQNKSNEVIIYASEVAVVLDKTLTAKDLSRLSDASFLSEIDPGFKHQTLSAQQANADYQKDQAEAKAKTLKVIELLKQRGKITAATAADLSAKAEQQLKINASATWCQTPGSVCLESVAKIPATYRALLKGASSVIDVPNEIEVLSEIKPLSQGVGVLQTGFMANKSLVSLKNEIRAFDLGSGQSLLTVKTLVMIEKDDLDKFQSFGSYNFVIGESFLNSSEGITMGLPLYAQKMAEALKEKL